MQSPRGVFEIPQQRRLIIGWRILKIGLSRVYNGSQLWQDFEVVRCQGGKWRDNLMMKRRTCLDPVQALSPPLQPDPA